MKKINGPNSPKRKKGLVKVSLCSIDAHLVYGLCWGYSKEPYKITECLHKFCKSCLFFVFQSGFRWCPTYDWILEQVPFRCGLSDCSLHELMHKIFSSLQDMDDKYEKKFYKAQDVKRKVLLEESNNLIITLNKSSEMKHLCTRVRKKAKHWL